MHRRKILTLAAGLTAGLVGTAAVARVAHAVPARPAASRRIRVVTADLAPLTMEHGGKRPGALMELVQELARRLGWRLEIEFVPWRRAQFLATTMPNTAIFPLTRLTEREPQFRWLAPLYTEHYVFLASRHSHFDLARLDDMKSMRITLIRGAAQTAIMREFGYNNLVEAASVDEVHRFLVQGMADAAFGERNIIRASLRSRRQEQDFETSAPLRSTVAWLAGSLDFTDDDARLCERAMAGMSADGTTRRMLAAYGLE